MTLFRRMIKHIHFLVASNLARFSKFFYSEEILSFAMASIQSFVVKSYLKRLKAYVRTHILDIPRLRIEKERVMGSLKSPREVETKPTSIKSVPGMWFTPPKMLKGKLLYYLHGGGYAAGSINTHQVLIGKLALSCELKTLAINYKLAPENPYPAGLNDVLDVYLWLISEGGYQPKDIVIAGDSAGGGMTLAFLLALKAKRLPMPLSVACLSPWTDLALTGESIILNESIEAILPSMDVLKEWAAYYIGNDSAKNPLISPLYGDLRGLPPMLIQVGTDEIIVDDSTRFADRAKKAGVDCTLEVWNGMPHVWHICWQYLPEGKQAINRIAEYFQEQYKKYEERKDYEHRDKSLLQRTTDIAAGSFALMLLGASIVKDILKN